MVEQKGIAYHPAHQVTRVDGRHVVFSDDLVREADLLVYVPPIGPRRRCAAPSSSTRPAGCAWTAHTLETPFPRVYALGDVTLIPLAMGKPLPRAGVFAHGQAEVVARNIARAVEGRPMTERFSGRGACFVETGGGRAGFGFGRLLRRATPGCPVCFGQAGSGTWQKVLFERQVMWQWL